MGGAAGGLLTARVFGGDPVERAARGAVWGAGAGAATGAMVGAKEDSERKASEKTKREADIAQLKSKFGEDAYNGLVALVEGKRCFRISSPRTRRSARPRWPRRRCESR